MDEIIAKYIVTNGKTFVGPFLSDETAYDYIRHAELYGWYVMPMTHPACFDPFARADRDSIKNKIK